MHKIRNHAVRALTAFARTIAHCAPIALLCGIGALSAPAQSPTFGPLMPQNGFPQFYSDGHGTSLGLCITNPTMCELLTSVAEPLDGLPFPDNYSGTFPDESFYWLASAIVPTAAGGQGLLVLGLEATFSTGFVLPGDQTTFARMRLRADNLIPGQTYHVTTPYGEFDTIATRSGRRSINLTQDIGLIPGDFSSALGGNVFPFLRWDSDLPIVDGQGNRFIGNPLIPHTVTGGPSGNIFRIDGPGVGGAGIDSVSTDLWSIIGMEHVPPPVAGFRANMTTGTAPLGVSFASEATGAIGRYDWSFGDGGTSRASNPAHVYLNPGVYTVSLTVTGPGGSDTKTVTDMIRVTPQPPRLALDRNEGPGRRLRLIASNLAHGAKIALLGSPFAGAAPFRVGRCGVVTGLQQPAVQVARTSGGGTSQTIEMTVPLGLAGQTCYFQVVDPMRCKIAEQADLHLAVLPGTDVLLAWSVAVELERMGALDAAFIAEHVLGFEAVMARARQWPAARRVLRGRSAATRPGSRALAARGEPAPRGLRWRGGRRCLGDLGPGALRLAARRPAAPRLHRVGHLPRSPRA